MNAHFDRVPMEWRPAIEAALDFIPDSVIALTNPQFLVGVSPRFVGLHSHDMATTYPEVAKGGRTYDNCAHAHFAKGEIRPTVIVPRPDLYSDPVGTLLHEVGHLFDQATRFSLNAPVTTPYSNSNKIERIAEAFRSILKPESGAWEDYVGAEAFRSIKTAMGLAA